MVKKFLSLLFVLPLTLLSSCAQETTINYVIDRDADLYLYGQDQLSYRTVTYYEEAPSLLSRIRQGESIMLGIFGDNCLPCYYFQKPFTEMVLEHSIRCYSYINGSDNYYEFLSDVNEIYGYYESNQTISTPTLLLLNKDEYVSLPLSGEGTSISSWTSDRLYSLIDDYARLDNIYRLDSSAAMFKFAETHPDSPIVLVDQSNQADLADYYQYVYPTIKEVATPVAFYEYAEDSDPVTLTYFGLSSYQAVVKKGEDVLPLNGCARLFEGL